MTFGRPSFGSVAIAVTAAALLLRLCFAVDHAGEVDSIRFVEAVVDYDVTQHRPHAPGYPVYVAIAKAVATLTGGDPLRALVLVSAGAGALLTLAAGLLARSLFGQGAGIAAMVLTAINPALWLYSEKILSDVPGLLFLVCSLALLVRGRLLWAFFMLGLTMGVRLSYFPFVIGALAFVLLDPTKRRDGLRAAMAVAGGVLVFALPMIADAGISPLVEVGLLQGNGHFTRWGGSVVTRPDMVERGSMLAWAVFAHGLGGWWTDRPLIFIVPTVAAAAVVVLGLLRVRPGTAAAPSGPARLLALLVAPYFVWVLFGQNVTEKPRHVLPLVFFAVLGLSVLAVRAMEHGRAAQIAFSVVLAGQTLAAFAVVSEHRAVPSNAVRLARAVGRVCETADQPVVVYTASFGPHLAAHAPCAEVVRVRRLSQAERDLARNEAHPIAFVVSDVAKVERLGREPIAEFHQNRYVQNSRREVRLYRMQ